MKILMNKKTVIIILLIAAIIILRNSPLADYLTFENIIKNKNRLLQMVENNYFISSISFILIYFFAITFSLPGAAILSLGGGMLFNVFPGVFYVNIGATAGALMAFIVDRYLLGGKIQEKYAKSLKRFNGELKANGHYYLLTLRMIPVFPFFLINFLAGLTNIRIWTFFWTTSLGILPGSLAYTYAGRNLGSIDSPGEIFSTKVILAFTALGLFAIAPPVLKKLFTKQKAEL
ncbi:MAG: TVP38/TMEM64 family protein [Flexistipes sinusarabici]|uniref:TVP38/TMEM64 family membrane protein n=2 Tax=Flexistipes sinusarabici TaxID=2352 RepID=A0A5D0MPR3_FLESI|nr:MAG: TVP38/TMEM64 family protein [Flexistipes sinusarabici]